MKTYRDHYFLKAKQENYPARSVYKLKEMDLQFKIFKKGMKVLDLGAAPGSWSLGAAEKVGEQGLIIAADILKTNTVFSKQVFFFQEDVFNRTPEFEAKLLEYSPFDVIMSDMAPNTTGHKFTDQARSLNLCEAALDVAKLHLKVDGTFIVKIFMGPDVQNFFIQLRSLFLNVKIFKPKSSRVASKEIFQVALGFKGNI